MTPSTFSQRYPAAPPPVHHVCPHCKRAVHGYVFSTTAWSFPPTAAPNTAT